MGGTKLIHLTLHLRLVTAVHDAWVTNIVTVPEAIGFDYPMNGDASAKSIWVVANSTHLNLNAINNATIDWDTGESLYSIDAFYVKDIK